MSVIKKKKENICESSAKLCEKPHYKVESMYRFKEYSK